jgi:Uncharacterized protein conserved in bacteria (DUF2263)
MSHIFLTKIFNTLREEDFKTPTLIEFYTSWDSKDSILHHFVEHVAHGRDFNTVCDDIKTRIIQHVHQGKIQKTQIIQVIHEYINMTNVVNVSEDPDEVGHENIDDIIEEVSVRRNNTNIDADFKRKNEIIQILHDTERKCVMFEQMDMSRKSVISTVLKKIYIFDHIGDCIQTIEIPEICCTELLGPVYKMTSCACVIRCVQNSYLNEIAHNTLLCVSGSNMVPGGGTEQGMHVQETPLYLATSYSLAINQLSGIYPMSTNHVVYIPNVLVFKDHTTPEYLTLQPLKSKKISACIAFFKYGNKCNSENLHDANTKLLNPNDITVQINNMLKTAQFFGHTKICIDDCGVNDYNLPVYHVAQILSECIHAMKCYFESITIACGTKATYDIYNSYICK